MEAESSKVVLAPVFTGWRVHAAPTPHWSALTRFVFRLGFVYLGLFNLEVMLHLVSFPPFGFLERLFNVLRGYPVRWVGTHILHVSHDFGIDYLNPTEGSKDTTYYYVQALCYAVVALVAACVWSFADRKRQEYSKLYSWFLLYLRVSLAVGLISYGATKIFPYQFAPPLPSQLLDTYGSSTRNQLLWMSMQVSPLYSFFGGLMEIAAGVLVMVPGLATLGALLSTAVLGNVAMLNFGYDVAAKLLVIHLVAMGLIILLPDISRLADFFLLRRSAQLVTSRPLFVRASFNRWAIVLQLAFAILLTGNDVYRSYQRYAEIMAARNTPLYGIWSVDEYDVNGVPRPAMSDNPHRWQRMIVNSKDEVVVQVMTGASQSLYLRTDPLARSFVLTEYGLPGWIAELKYDDSRAGALVLGGRMGGVPVLIRLHREDDAKFALNDHSVHWIRDVRK